MHCTNCGTPADASAAFCENCGTSLHSSAAGSVTVDVGQATPTWSGPDTGDAAVAGFPPQVEDRGRRVIAYVIDLVPMILLAVLHFLPIVGWMFYGLIHACYWLFRDYTGASLGKAALGAYVTSEDGSPSTTRQRIIRNVPLAIPGIIGMIPLVGIFFEAAFALVIFGGESLMLLLTGRRLGDYLAGTTVYRKGASL
jgi:uncharacterized RDD family membrane protein YckC